MASLWLLTAFLGLLVLCFLKYIASRPKNLPPGPNLLTFLKDIWPLIRGRTDQLTLLSSWAEKYGDIVSLYVGPKLFIFLNSYPAITEAFRHPDLQDRPQSRIMLETFGQTTNLVFASGEVWKEQRKFVQSVLRSLGVGKKTFEGIIATEMSKLNEAIQDKEGAPFNPSFLFGRTIANIICSVVFGTQYQYDDEEFKNVLDTINDNFRLYGGGGAVLFLNVPWISKLPFGTAHKLANNFRSLRAIFVSQIELHEKNLDPENPKDFIDLYLNKLNEIEGDKSSFSKRCLAGTIGDLFAAGTETTATTLNWCVLYMMAYPEVQSRVQEELDQVIGRDRRPRLDDRQDLPYTAAVLMEVQRIATVGPLGVPHLAAANSNVHGYVIPKGATIVSNVWKILHDEQLWKDAGSFQPERFINDEGKLVKRDELIFFGTGRRICPGEQLARMEIFLGFTSLLHRFSFMKPEETESLSLKGVLGLTLNPTPYMTCAIDRK